MFLNGIYVLKITPLLFIIASSNWCDPTQNNILYHLYNNIINDRSYMESKNIFCLDIELLQIKFILNYSVQQLEDTGYNLSNNQLCVKEGKE